MTRYVVDAPTLLHLVAEGVEVDPDHQLVAPNLVRSQALALLYEAVRSGDLEREAGAAAAPAAHRAEDAAPGRPGLARHRLEDRDASTAGSRPTTPSTSPSPGCRPTPSSRWTQPWPRRSRAWCRSRPSTRCVADQAQGLGIRTRGPVDAGADQALPLRTGEVAPSEVTGGIEEVLGPQVPGQDLARGVGDQQRVAVGEARWRPAPGRPRRPAACRGDRGCALPRGRRCRGRW